MDPEAQTFDVFLSHHSGDKPWVIYLKSALASRGVTVWLDKDEIRPGDLFIDALDQGIERSSAVALIVSPASMKSAWVREEYQRALTLSNSTVGLRLIPCLLRDATLPGFLTNRHWVDFREPNAFEQKVDELCWGITGKKPDDGPSRVTPPPVSSGTVTDAEIAYLESAVLNRQKDRRRILVLRACALACGVGGSALWATASASVLSLSPQYLGPPLVTGLVGVGMTERKWSEVRSELKRLIAHRDALSMCRRTPAPVCPDVIDAFNRFVKRSIGVG